MNTLHFSIRIQAAPAKVWHTMLDQRSYQQWTASFCEGSSYEGSWQQGSRMRFLAPNGQGMYGIIAENRLCEFLSIQHLGEIDQGKDMPTDQHPSVWTHAHENYTFVADGAGTLLKVDVDSVPEYESWMKEAWPKALTVLKQLCE